MEREGIRAQRPPRDTGRRAQGSWGMTRTKIRRDRPRWARGLTLVLGIGFEGPRCFWWSSLESSVGDGKASFLPALGLTCRRRAQTSLPTFRCWACHWKPSPEPEGRVVSQLSLKGPILPSYPAPTFVLAQAVSLSSACSSSWLSPEGEEGSQNRTVSATKERGRGRSRALIRGHPAGSVYQDPDPELARGSWGEAGG